MFCCAPSYNILNFNSHAHCRLRGQVDDVVDVMKSNVSKVIERGDRLEDLQDKSGTEACCHYGPKCSH